MISNPDDWSWSIYRTHSYKYRWRCLDNKSGKLITESSLAFVTQEECEEDMRNAKKNYSRKREFMTHIKNNNETKSQKQTGKTNYFKLLLAWESIAVISSFVVIFGIFGYAKILFPYLKTLGFSGGWQAFSIIILVLFCGFAFLAWCFKIDDDMDKSKKNSNQC